MSNTTYDINSLRNIILNPHPVKIPSQVLKNPGRDFSCHHPITVESFICSSNSYISSTVQPLV